MNWSRMVTALVVGVSAGVILLMAGAPTWGAMAAGMVINVVVMYGGDS